MQIRTIKQSYPLTFTVPLEGATAEVLEVFIKRFSEAEGIDIDVEETRSSGCLKLTIHTEEGMNLMPDILYKPVTEEDFKNE